ncbi:ubiquinone/menaquinone biosynthesis C-methylase UbiE [Roseibium hamelinense]|uniref:Ubiquinone/menaquinone biosynthesis C-methylase UbiE n=1 Tax=Roseibium hamelinense TaxID=150831 RepID=A0A562SYL9_9HYPH|nr:methyltransferase [Roseibium hamelinense]MTI43612.1 methyltransferase domain-containing protein [Roseibium hamelinense]TWI86128.1 ubiquinone/menaquinone biosynthesis C-methylase UbiE [Roseibium hamelinense]
MAKQPLETAEQISEIAFGFMGSKALFAALHVDLFSALSDKELAADEVAAETGLDSDRATTLLTALNTLGLVEADDGRFKNAPAADAFLVTGRKYAFGDYLRFQIDRQMYPFLTQLNDALTDNLAPDQVSSYAQWFSDADEARLYSQSQHAGSLGPGRTLAKLVDLSQTRSLLDVGGGTGAFSISLCEAYPELKSTILDFPNVAKVGEEFIKKAGLSDRVWYQPGNALDDVWPAEADAVLMSYLFSGVPGKAIPGLVKNAMVTLPPGGHFMVHDFMVSGERTGPKLAALWQLQHTAFNPHAKSITSDYVSDLMEAAGFEDVNTREMIPGMTTLVWARKPQ